jgi:hypothetical protein
LKGKREEDRIIQSVPGCADVMYELAYCAWLLVVSTAIFHLFSQSLTLLRVMPKMRAHFIAADSSPEVNVPRLFAVILFCAVSTHCFSQVRFVDAWEKRVRITSSRQPGWAVPVFTPSSGLVQLVRFDAVRQYTPTHTTTWNLDGGKGFNFIPWYRTELDLNLPPFLLHNAKGSVDGPGDFSMLLKYRVFGANEMKGNYNVSAALGGSAPTGSYKNGSTDGAVMPTAFVGKGFYSFDVQSSVSMTLPTGHTAASGRPIAWNTAFQDRVNRIFWPEVEITSTFFRGGPHDGKIQTFVAPGFEVSKIKVTANETSRLAVVFGAGEQIAVTRYHAYNHALSLTSRLVF